MLKLLIVEGNTKEARELAVAAGSLTQSALYKRTLLSLRTDADCSIVCPADGNDGLPSVRELESYDGIIWTGSSLNIYDTDPAITRQIDFMKRCFKGKLNIFGSCWGLQVAVVATGGKVVKNAKGREVGIARDIVTTPAGKAHPLYKDKHGPFDANAIHLDHVEILPKGATVLSGNDMSFVQALEIKRGKAVFWGVQYHPEFDLEYMAYIVEKYKKMMVDENICPSAEAVEKLSADFRAVQKDFTRQDIIAAHNIGKDVLDPCCRLQEVSNWLDYIEQPAN